MARFLGQDQNQNISSSTAQDTSLIVIQFLELARGEREVRQPHQWGTLTVTAEERYCLGCCEVRWMDVVRFQAPGGRMMVCRLCRVEDWG
jgi:hypothetical protein